MKNITKDYAIVNGLKMYYEIHGEGEPIVLIHGGGSTIQTTFGNLLPYLTMHNKVIAVELQAHGRTSDRSAPESFEQDADDVVGLLQQLKISRAGFIGFSNGGNTAMQIGIRHKQVVNKLVIISALYQREGMLPGFFDGLNEATINEMPGPLKAAFLEVNNDPRALQTMFEKDKARMLSFTDWDDNLLTSLSMPTLVMSADHDVVLPAHVLKMSQLIPGARLMILPGTHGSFIGEICSVEKGSRQTEMTALMIEEFLSSGPRD